MLDVLTKIYRQRPNLVDSEDYVCMPCLALPCLALPCLALPCLALPCLALPCLALPCLALPCLALPCLALPCLALPCLALPCLALPCLALPCLAYPVVSVDRWGTTDDLATSSLHSSRLSAFLMAAPSVKPVHSGMLSSHFFFCLPRLLPPWTVPCMIVLASPDDLVMCTYHLSLRCLTVARRSSWGPMACRVLFRTSSLEMWSL